MADIEALSRVTYGLYIVSSGDRNRGNGFISNTVFQVSSKPVKFALCCNKVNLTADFIREYGTFSVSILSVHTPAALFGTFGYTSGRDTDKFKDMDIIYGNTDVPIVLNSSIAWLELKLVQTVDAGTHYIFIGELVNSALVNDAGDPITYSYYRQVLKAFAPKNAPTYIENTELLKKHSGDKSKKFVCPECGYVYDEANEDIRFADLPDDWICPVCGTPKSEFAEIL